MMFNKRVENPVSTMGKQLFCNGTKKKRKLQTLCGGVSVNQRKRGHHKMERTITISETNWLPLQGYRGENCFFFHFFKSDMRHHLKTIFIETDLIMLYRLCSTFLSHTLTTNLIKRPFASPNIFFESAILARYSHDDDSCLVSFCVQVNERGKKNL